ncbi:MAG: glycosyltransferase [Myxococcaceae bacterium]
MSKPARETQRAPAPERRPLRICHLGKFYPPASGGMETHVQTLARAQAALGAEVEVLCVNHRDERGEDVTHRSFAAPPEDVSHDGAVRVHRLARNGSFARLDVTPGLTSALRLLERRDVDLLHVHTPNPAMLLGLMARGYSGPLIITHHSDVVRQRVLGAAFRPVEVWAYKRASLILATSAHYIDGSPLLRRFKEKVQPLPLGIDLAPFLAPTDSVKGHASAYRREYGAPLWLSVGRLVYYKGLVTALEALRWVPGKLFIVGVGPDEALLRRRAMELGVGDRTIFAGRLSEDELAGAYAAATALWFPSNARSEAFGLAQVEALASGCPVINTAIAHSGVPWVSRDGETGFTVKVGDSAGLAEASQRLLRLPLLRERMAVAGKQRARADFDHQLMARRSLELYRSIEP